MADSNRTVVFDARGDNVISEFDRIKSSAQQMMGDMIREATEYSEISRQQVTYIEEQIRGIERRNRLIAESKAMEGGGSLTPTQATEARGDRLQTTVLKDILEELRTQSKEEIAADREGVQKRLNAAKKDSFIESLTPEEQFVLAQQGSVLDDEESQGGGGRFGAMMRGMGGRAAGAGRFAVGGLMAPAAMLASIPIIGGLLDRMVNLGTALSGARRGFSGMTGITESGFGYDVGDDFGVGQTEFLQYARTLSRTRGGARTGNVNRNLQQETSNLLASEVAFGLDPQSLISLSKYQPYDTNQRGTAGDVQNIIKIMKAEGLFKGGDFSRLQGMLEGTVNIMETQARVTETINSDDIATRVASFQRIGGSFAGVRGFERMNTMNQALTSPGNEFKQAFMYSTLRQLAPEATFEELQELQEEGIYGKTSKGTVLGGTLRNIQSRGGGKGLMMQNIKSLFGLSMQQSRTLTDAFLEDNSIFDSTKNITAALQGADIDVQKRARERTPPMTKMMTDINEILAAGGETGINYLQKTIDSILDGGIKFGNNRELNEATMRMGKARASGDEAGAMEASQEVKRILGQETAPKSDVTNLSQADKLISLTQLEVGVKQNDLTQEQLDAQIETNELMKSLLLDTKAAKGNAVFEPEE